MIRNTFKQRSSLFIPFLMAGYPTAQIFEEAVLTLANAGADIIEVGVPFSDPVADGPINQEASRVGIDNGMSLAAVLEQIQRIRAKGCDTPIILFSYLNPIMAYGYEFFCQQAKKTGVNGLLVVDLPPEEGKPFYELAQRQGLEIVLLVSPTTTTVRLKNAAQLNPSFIYYISRLSVTGVQNELSEGLEHQIAQLREYIPGTPVAVGFGISTPEQAQMVSKFADGVIVGSKLVKTLGEHSAAEFKQIAESFIENIHRE